LSERLKKLETIDVIQLDDATLAIDLNRLNDQSIAVFESWLQELTQ
jgi:hypothetical protein